LSSQAFCTPTKIISRTGELEMQSYQACPYVEKLKNVFQFRKE
jgi:hypothetical protein